ncbi:hypothetical protein IL099_001507 [Enterococcus hirae]|nr:hypothetical protein [Enterococcus hirae]
MKQKWIKQFKSKETIKRVFFWLIWIGIIVSAFLLGGRIQQQQINFEKTLVKLNEECAIIQELKRKEMPQEIFWSIRNMESEIFQLMSYPEGIVSKLFFNEKENKENFAVTA